MPAGVTAVVQPATGASLDLASLAAHCRQHLAGYKVPKHLVVVDRVVRSPAGCGQPPVETGYADTFDTFTATGEYGSTTTLDSPPHPVTVQECTTPGDPTQPCAGPTTAVQATLQVHLRLATDFA